MTETTADQNSDFSSSPPTSRLEDGNLVTNLQCQLKSFQIRVKELEAQNAALYLQLSNCHCQKLVERSDASAVFGDALAKGRKKSSIGDNMVQLSIGGNHNDVKIKDAKREGENGAVNEAKKNSSRILKTMNRHSKRYVALKVMYFGQRFHGFASVQVDPTIESEIFKALEQTRLLVADRKESQYTRCGRTDKGVSSVGQVISLFLRSKCTDCGVDAARFKAAPEAVCVEIDYVKVLNKVLPKDIRVVGWSPVPLDFHARFGCSSREYKYLFWRGSLDISAIEMAGKKFVGEHDFRNFCKMDALHVHNYRRNITSFQISICNERAEGDQLWEISVKGSAFLWHQIRCMVAVLFMIGQGLESPSVVDALLDTTRIHRKPQFCMAPELPLVLRSCEFEGLKFSCSPALWWKRYRDSTPELQDLAVRVLSATCSSTGCKRNWSTFQQVHARRRNRLEQQRMNALVYVKYNIKLEQRKKKRDKRGDAFDPISLSDMESDDEWICEKEDPALPQDPSWMDVHEFFDVVESASSRSKKRKRKRDAGSDLQEHFKSEVRNYKLQVAIFQEALLGCSSMENCKSPSNQCKKVAHIPLLSRPTEPTYEERLAKLKVRAEP